MARINADIVERVAEVGVTIDKIITETEEHLESAFDGARKAQALAGRGDAGRGLVLLTTKIEEARSWLSWITLSILLFTGGCAAIRDNLAAFIGSERVELYVCRACESRADGFDQFIGVVCFVARVGLACDEDGFQLVASGKAGQRLSSRAVGDNFRAEIRYLAHTAQQSVFDKQAGADVSITVDVYAVVP